MDEGTEAVDAPDSRNAPDLEDVSGRGPRRAPPRSSSSRWLVALVVVSGGAAAMAGFVVLLLYAQYKQPSGSMLPSFEVGAHVSVNRLDKTPARGAVIAFEYPERREQSFFKRVVGVPGDSIETVGGLARINGWDVPVCIVGRASFTDPSDPAAHEGQIFVEFLDAEAYLVFIDRGAAFSERAGPFVVKKGEVFVLGDNRNNSHDSRMWFGGQGGGVPFDHVIGRVRTGSAPQLPKGKEALRGALDACLAKRPVKTTPPSPSN